MESPSICRGVVANAKSFLEATAVVSSLVRKLKRQEISTANGSFVSSPICVTIGFLNLRTSFFTSPMTFTIFVLSMLFEILLQNSLVVERKFHVFQLFFPEPAGFLHFFLIDVQLAVMVPVKERYLGQPV